MSLPPIPSGQWFWGKGIPAGGLKAWLESLRTTVAELESGSGTSEPGVDIQVGGSQPASGWWLDNGQPLPDTVAPSTPTGLTATATGGSTVNLSWTASTDNIGVAGYHYRIGTGAAVDAGTGTTETVTGLAPLTAYSFQVQAYDAQGNVSGWSTAANATTLDGPDEAAPTPGTLAASAITQSTFTLTVTGASDTVGLHATPYAFSTDNGATWSAWQAGATYDVTGRTASTAYQARHKVRDAAGNEATGTAITVTTSAPAPLLADTFDRATTTAPGSLGNAETGQPWVQSGAWVIHDNSAVLNAIGGGNARVDIGQVSGRASFTLRRVANNFTAGVFLGGPTGIAHASLGYRLSARVSSEGLVTVACIAYGTGWEGQVVDNILPSSGTVANDGDVFELTVVENGSQAVVTAKQNGTTLGSKTVTAANRPLGTFAGIACAEAGGKAGGVKSVVIYEQ